MARKCFISYKKEDVQYKRYLTENCMDLGIIDKSLDRTIDSNDDNYIMQVIRRDYLCDSTVTLFLIGEHSSENEGSDYLGHRNHFIMRELQASLYNGEGNTRNGILGIILPSMYQRILNGDVICSTCGGVHNVVILNDSTVIREFSSNYFIPHSKCCWQNDERYCELVKWDDFITAPENYIETAYSKRSMPISEKVRFRFLR